MKSFYINLENAAARRDSIEDSFLRHNNRGWILQRFQAIDADYVKNNKIHGALRDEEKACFLSHRKLIEQNADVDQHIFVVEDDSRFAPSTFETIDGLLRPPTPFTEWDLLFTDVGIFSIGAMADLVMLRRQLKSKDQIKLLDLKSLPFFGATAYIVNKISLKKVLQLTMVDSLDVPYDLFLRKMVFDGALRAFVTFPFLTSSSEHSLNSSVQQKSTERTQFIYEIFKRMIWIEGDFFDPVPLLDHVCQGVDERSNAYGRLWASMIDPGFQLK
jgi:GR25 family glycosyltransferase involved in LPS biosynthesis